MEPREAALLSSILHLPAGIMITSVHPSVTELVVCVACHAPSMPCPECRELSARIHGSYQRAVADLPCAGRHVLLLLTVRKFVCSTPACCLLAQNFYRAPARAGRVLWTHDRAAYRTPPSPWVRSRRANGHATSRPIRHRHQPVNLVTPSDAVACSAGTSGSGPWG